MSTGFWDNFKYSDLNVSNSFFFGLKTMENRMFLVSVYKCTHFGPYTTEEIVRDRENYAMNNSKLYTNKFLICR